MTKQLSAALLALGVTFAHAQTADGIAMNTPPVVRDARGHEVGGLSHFNFSYGALFTVGGERIVVAVERHSTTDDPLDRNALYSGSQFIYRSYISTLSYTSADCSGDPIVDDSTVGPSPAIVAREGTTVTAYIASKAPYETFAIASRHSTQTGVCTTLDTPEQKGGWPTGTKVVLSREHPEPLTIGY